MNRKLRDVLVLVAACLMLVWTIPSVGQVLKGSISGTVVDPQGAVVSGAQVKATHVSTGTVQTSKSDNAGLFRFNLIQTGSYKIEVAAPGFKTAVENDVLVAAGSDRDVGAVKLSVGEATTTVEVVGAAPLVDTTQAQVTNTFAGATLQTFAGIQENEGLDNLALFVPGIVAARDNGFSNTNGGTGFSSNGLRGRNNDQEIDGQNNNDNSVAGPALFVSDPEFVGQYVLVTNQFGPEYGRNSGSVVNIITKGGTNAWHGSVYENENNSILNSMSNFQKNFDTDASGNSLTQPPRLNDEFGGFGIGGPLVKNKAFFFGGFDQEITSTTALFQSGLLTPTPAGVAQLNSCFPGSPTMQAFNQFGPYAISGGNPVPTGAIANVPVTGCGGPGTTVPFAGVERALSAPFHGFNFVNREDVNLGSDTLMGRYIFNRGNTFNNDFGQAAAGFPVNVPALSQAVLLGDTHNFSSRMVNELRVGFNRLNVDFGGNSLGTVPVAGNVADAVTNISFQTPGFLGLGAATNLPQSRIVNTWQVQDNWTYVKGKHAFKAGVNWTYQRSPNIFLPDIDGAYRFGDWSAFAADIPNRVGVADGNPSLDFREKDTFIYGGDDWKIGKNLTLNLGLTWTYYGQPANLFNQITTANASSSTPLWNPALPASVTTFPVFPSPKNSFGPSIGFAYNPQWGGFLTGDGKTTFRGGYRMLYDPPFYNIYINMSSSAPEVFLQTFSPAQSATLPLPAVPTGPNVRASLSSFLTPGVFDPRTFAETTMSPNFGPDKVQSWSLGFEREITKNSALEVRYSGNHGYNLFQSVNANPLVAPLLADFPNLVPAGITPCTTSQQVGPGAGTDLGREFCGSGVTRSRTNTGFSNYNALQTEFRANNMFKQLTLRAAYTYSKTLDNVSEIFSTFAGANSSAFAQNPFNQSGEYAPSGLNIPNQFTILLNEDLPFFKEQHGVVGHILGGWAVSGNYILASGQGYSPTQIFSAEVTAPNFFDASFYNAFNSGVETARPFIGSLSAPATSVGMYAGDACVLFSLTQTDALCTGPTNQLISLTAVGKSGCESNSTIGCPFVPVTNNQVRFIANTGIAESVFGTPFGNAGRNPVSDAMTNVANLAIIKRFKFNERANFEFRASALNVFNHPNYSSVDPFLEDAGLHSAGTGFGDVTTSNTTFAGSNGGTRRFSFGGTFRF
ncbi:MAG TPA: carboxypeptidase regulatory-like domain-containing protein [Terriglobales bacterium]